MSDECKVTVVIPTYNRAHCIQNALDSVLKQTCRNWKLIVIDDASTDQTEEIIGSYKSRDHRINYFRMPTNLGVGHAMNKALELVDTEYLIQLDSDDWFANRTIESLWKAAERAGESTALTYGNHKFWKVSDRGILRRARSFTRLEKHELLTASTVYPRFYRTSCLRHVGGWDVDDAYGGRHMEDVRIMCKLIEHFDFLWVNKPLYHLSRLNKERLTAIENVYRYNDLKKDLVLKKLKEWGYELIPEFYSNAEGWLCVHLKNIT